MGTSSLTLPASKSDMFNKITHSYKHSSENSIIIVLLIVALKIFIIPAVLRQSALRVATGPTRSFEQGQYCSEESSQQWRHYISFDLLEKRTSDLPLRGRCVDKWANRPLYIWLLIIAKNT